MNKSKTVKSVHVQKGQVDLKKMKPKCGNVAELLKSLSHPQRLLILGQLTKGPQTVTELQSVCNISQSQLSQFLIRMKIEGLLSCERKGKYQYYFIKEEKVVSLMQSLQSIFCNN